MLQTPLLHVETARTALTAARFNTSGSTDAIEGNHAEEDHAPHPEPVREPTRQDLGCPSDPAIKRAT